VKGTGLPRRRKPSPNIGPRKAGKRPSILLLHYTGMKDADKAIDWLCDPRSKVSCHYLIDVDGRITQMVDEDMRAWHAGQSSWKGEHDINSCSIGIEIQNEGHVHGYPDFPGEQMDAVIALCRDIIDRWNMRPEHVLAHSDVAPHRKIDPGEKFDWRKLHRAGIGHWVKPSPIKSGPCVASGDEGEDVTAVQSKLALYGYGVEITGAYSENTAASVRAFQRHFRPARIDGIADRSTVDTLDRLIAALPSTVG
jgi:N-acetylmuramoyl-L-alanine amidase